MRQVPAGRRIVAALAALALAAGLAACGSDDEPEAPATTGAAAGSERALTPEESELLAVVRLVNYRDGTVPFTATVPVGSQTLSLSGRVDYRDHRLVAGFATDDQPPAAGVLAATFEAVGLLPTESEPTADELARAVRVPEERWQVRSLDDTDPLDQVMLVVLNLGADRPENSQLLRQNGARWLGSDEVDGTEVDVMAATAEADSTLTYYVDADGRLRRVDIRTGDAVPATVVFGEGPAPEVPVVPAVGSSEDRPAETIG